MPEGITAESLMNNIMDTISDSVSKHKNTSEGENGSVSAQFNRLFGRQKPIRNLLGGGKCHKSLYNMCISVLNSCKNIYKLNRHKKFHCAAADVLLWRDKKLTAGSLGAATLIWVLFEWLNYHFLTLLCFAVVLGMVVQFLWKNASGMLRRDPSSVPRLVLPEEVFVNTGQAIGSEVNRMLNFLQDVACKGNLKQFLVVVSGLWVAAIVGSWFSLLTVMYIGYVAAHTLPILYERYEDQVDSFVYSVSDQLQGHYKKFDDRVLSRIPAAKFRGKKSE